jgi:hypothetical protein
MIRVQFSLRTVFVVMTACALLLAWWAPADSGVQCMNFDFARWQPDLRVTTERQFCALVGGKPEQKMMETFDWPDFSKSDVIQVPVNGLARIIHGRTLARSASEGLPTSYPRLRFGLVSSTLRPDAAPMNNPG